MRLLIVFSLLRLLFKDCFCSGLSCSLISFVFFLRQIFFWSCSFLSSACAFHYLMFLSSCFCFRVPFPFRHFLLSFVLESSCFFCVFCFCCCLASIHFGLFMCLRLIVSVRSAMFFPCSQVVDLFLPLTGLKFILFFPCRHVSLFIPLINV